MNDQMTFSPASIGDVHGIVLGTAFALPCYNAGMRISISLDGGNVIAPMSGLSGSDPRRCCVCGSSVQNDDLGGYSGRSALSGILWCERCVDDTAPVIGGAR